jgi:hypothetical protein
VCQELHSYRLLPGFDDDEVNSPRFPFARFEALMATSYLNHIRHPQESRYQVTNWLTKLAPHWRWAQAHSFIEAGRASFCDDDTYTAYDVLRTRARGLVADPDILPLVTAILIYEKNDRTRWLLESHLLLPELPANLAGKLGLAPATIQYYESWFFDVRWRLTRSSWISARALGGCPWLGLEDDDWAPIWRRVAYCTKSERMLDTAVAITTGVGRERFCEIERDAMQLWIEEKRMSPVSQPDKVLQLYRRLQAEQIGAHPSCYYRPDGKRAARRIPLHRQTGKRRDTAIASFGPQGRSHKGQQSLGPTEAVVGLFDPGVPGRIGQCGRRARIEERVRVATINFRDADCLHQDPLECGRF